MITLKVLVTDYEKFSEKWEDFTVTSLTLPIDSSQLEQYTSSKTQIIRYEFDDEDFDLAIDPKVDLRDLNLLMQYIQNLHYLDTGEFLACLEFYKELSYNNIIQKFKSKNYDFYGSITDEEELAHFIIDNEIDGITMSTELQDYFSFDDFGRDYADDHNGHFTEYGYFADK